MVVLTESDLAEAGLEGTACSFQRAVIDSREVKPGDLFICLKGESTDGHLFAADAVRNGATALLCQKDSLDGALASLRAAGDIAPPAILVAEDAVAALQALGRLRRRRYCGTVIAVVGSNGKTSTKEILAALLRSLHGEDAVFATPGNWNNHLGVPLSLCALPDGAAFAVLELGMNHPGEIALLADIARPHHCVVPSIGLEHMEFFASIHEVARAELEVLTGIEKGACLVYPAEAPELSFLREEASRRGVAVRLFALAGTGNVADGEEGVRDAERAGSGEMAGARYEAGRLLLPDGVFETGEYRGEAMASNILACLTLLRSVPALQGPTIAAGRERLQQATQSLRPVAKGRFRLEKVGATVLVDDTYNANPDSFHQSLRSLREILPDGRLLCLMGHMAELGHFSREGHEAVGRYMAESGFGGMLLAGRDDVRLAGNSWQKARVEKGGKEIGEAIGEGRGREGEEIKYFEDSTALSNYIEKNPDSVRGWDGILVKGSRSARMEKVLPAVRSALAGRPGA